LGCVLGSLAGHVIGELGEVPALMSEVVFDEKAEGYGGVIADRTIGGESLFGDAVDDGGEDLMLGLPPAEQGFPVLCGITVSGDPAIRRVLGPM